MRQQLPDPATALSFLCLAPACAAVLTAAFAGKRSWLAKALIILVLLSAIAPPADASIAHVQGAPSTDNTNRVTLLTIDSGPSALSTTTGNSIIVRIAYQADTQTIQSCTDSGGSVFQKAIGPAIGSGGLAGYKQEIWLAKNIVGHAANVVTCTFTASLGSAFAEITWEEESGVNSATPIDGTPVCNTGNTGGPDSASSGNITATMAGDLIWAAAVFTGSGTASAGFTQRSVQNLDATEDFLQWAPGAVAGTFTPQGTVYWITCAVALSPSTPPSGAVGIVHVQGAPNTDKTINDTTTAVSSSASASPTTSGNAIIARVSYQATTQTIQSCTDSGGSTFQRVAGPSLGTGGNAGYKQEIWLAKNIVGHAANAVTCNFSASLGGAAFADITWEEYLGVNATTPVDGTAACNTGNSSGTDSASSGNITTTVAGDLIWSSAIFSVAGMPSTGFVPRSFLNGSPTTDLIQSSPGVIAATFTPDRLEDWFACAVALRPATPAASTPVVTHLGPNSGAIGSSVVIAGLNFGATQGTSTVKFNGSTATTVGPWSNSSITAVVPAGATTGNLVVTVGGVASTGLVFSVVPAPSISSLSAVSGPLTTPVTISGANFGSSQGNGSVTFNGVAATGISLWSDTSIVVTVPFGTTTGGVVVKAAGGVASNAVTFTVTPAVVQAQGAPNTDNWSGATASTIASGESALPTTTGNAIIARIAYQAAAQTVQSCTDSGGSVFQRVAGPATGSGALSGYKQEIWLAKNIVGHAANVVTCTFSASLGGTAFAEITWDEKNGVNPTSPTDGTPLCSTGNTSAADSASSGNITTTLSGDVIWAAGFFVTSASVGSGFTLRSNEHGDPTEDKTQSAPGPIAGTFSPSAAQNWIVCAAALVPNTPANAPAITGLSPSTGAIGSSIVIAGSNFGATQGTSTVKVNGTTATTVGPWSATSITATVPTGATTGNVVVTVGGVASNGVPFTVTPAPAITSLAPNTGAVGSVVTITGTNFGPSQGNGGVTFSTKAAVINSWSDTSIVAVVPTGATTGSVVVKAAGGVSSAGVTFTVTAAPAITSLSPTSGAFGSSFTITGTNFGSQGPGSAVTLNGVTAATTSWNATTIVAQVPAGVTTGNVVVTAAGGISSNAVLFKVLNPGGLAVDQIVASDGTTTSTTRATAAFSTTTANELLLAFVSTGKGTAATTTVSSIAGGGLTWALVQRTNTQAGTAEIWRAFAATALTNVTVTATLSQSVLSSMTVVTFTGVDTTGTNGSGAIGAIATANAASGAPAATLTTTRANSAVFAVGDDPTARLGRTPGANQSIVHQLICPSTQTCTLWVQQVPTLVPSSGTVVTLNDTAPTADAWNLSLVEIKPVATAVAPAITTLAPVSGSVGNSVTINGSNFGASQGTSTVTFGGISTSPALPANWTATSIVVPVPAGVALGAVPVVVTVGGLASNSATFTVVAPLAISAVISPTPNAAGWNNGNVTVSYACTGGVPPLQCPAPVTVIIEGANQVVSATAADANGNQATISVSLNIDKTTPTITAVVSPLAVGGIVTAPATVTFTCSDALSGVVSCPSPITVNTAGLNQTFSGTATDKAGNSATASVTLNVQTAPLTVTASPAPAANAARWNNSNVTISYTCAGGVPPVVCSAAQTVTTEGANQIISATATDAASQTASASVTLNIDKTAPALAITAPVTNAVVTNASLPVSGTLTDGLSGVSAVTCNGAPATFQAGAFNCTVTLASGANTIAVVATDVAENPATQSVTATFAVPAITDFNPKSGSAGTLVTLTGTNLVLGAGGATVTLNQQGAGTIAAPVTSAGPASISFLVPPGAATGAVTVTTAGESAVSAAIFTVTARSSFGLSVGPATATLIQGQSVAYSVALGSADGFTQLATLSVAGLPAGVTAQFNPARITNGQISILTVSAPAGQAVANSTLTISANATVDGIASTQSATVVLSVQPVTTSFFGRILESDTIETPIPGIVATFLGKDDANNPTGCTAQTTSDAAGNFLFTNLPAACVGRQLLGYNGNTSSDGELYTSVNLAYTVIAGQAVGPEIVHLPRTDNAETVLVHQNWPTDQVVTFTSIPGITATIYAGTTLTMKNGTTPEPFPLKCVQVPVDRLPDVPVDGPGQLRAFIVALQPEDTVASLPISVVWPNSLNMPPGVNMELQTLDPVVGTFIKYGTGTVSSNASQIVPDPDPAHPGHLYGISHFDWHGPVAPPRNAKDPCPSRGSGCASGGDPVDLSSGLFVYNKTDLAFGGARGHVSINRTYRTLTSLPGPFGLGSSYNYGYQLNVFWLLQGQGFVNLVMPDGNQLPFTLSGSGTLTNANVPSLAGAVITIGGNGAYSLRWKNGTVLQFQAPTARGFFAYLNSITDSNNNVTTMVHGNPASPSQITQIVDPVGRALSLTYDNFDRITSIVDPIGRTVTYAYNNQGTLAAVTDAAGGVTSYTYDNLNRMTDITDPRGIRYLHNDYDGNGMVARQTNADGGITTFAYTLLNPTSTGQFINTGGGGGGVTNLTFATTTISTSPVLLTTVTDPLGNQTTYHFNPQGLLIDVTDAMGEKTIYTLDSATNRVLSVTDSLNRTTALTYDAAGNMLSSTSLAGTPNAVTSLFTYDPTFNKVTSVTDPLNHTTSFAYDPATGNLLTVTDPLNHQTSYAYDGFGELQTLTDALGNKTQFAYSNGSLSSVTDPLTNTATSVSDAAGRVLSETSPLGQTTTYSYNALDLPTLTTDPLGGTTSITYDGNGNLLSLTDPLNHATNYTYDVMDRLATRTDPLQRPEGYQYDVNGNLTQVTDRRGKVTTFGYDALNRQIFAGFGTNAGTFESTITYTYDAVGRAVRIADSASGVITEQYDNLNRRIVEATPQGSVSYTYDTVGRKTRATVAGQPAINYTYDNASRLTSLARGAAGASLSYDNLNRRTSLTLPNSVSVSYSYDADSQLTAINYLNGVNLLGNLTYSYDALGRRTQVGGSFARTGMPLNIASTVYDVANQLTNWNGMAITYDSNGNMLNDGSHTITWNARNQAATLNGATMQYDAFGRRVKNGVGTSFLYDGVNAAQEQSAAGNTDSLLTGGVDELFTRTDAAGSFTALHDALGSAIALVDVNGNLSTQYTYDPFGNTTTSGNGSNNPSQYTGRENEGNGLYYYRARYYSPLLGRFISQDPIRFGGGLNLYAYVKDSPVNFVDFSGLDKNDPSFGQCLLNHAQDYSMAGVVDLGLAAIGHGDFQPGHTGIGNFIGGNDIMDGMRFVTGTGDLDIAGVIDHTNEAVAHGADFAAHAAYNSVNGNLLRGAGTVIMNDANFAANVGKLQALERAGLKAAESAHSLGNLLSKVSGVAGSIGKVGKVLKLGISESVKTLANIGLTAAEEIDCGLGVIH